MLKIKKIKPMFTHLITTTDKYEEDVVTSGGLITVNRQKGSVKEYQRVVAVGSMVKDIKVGDLVLINPKNYRVLKHEKGSMKDGVITDNPIVGYNIPTVEINGEQFMYLDDRDIEYVIEDYEEVEDPKPSTKIITPPTDIIV